MSHLVFIFPSITYIYNLVFNHREGIEQIEDYVGHVIRESCIALVLLFYGTGARACYVFSTGAKAIYIQKNEDIWETLVK